MKYWEIFFSSYPIEISSRLKIGLTSIAAFAIGGLWHPESNAMTDNLPPPNDILIEANQQLGLTFLIRREAALALTETILRHVNLPVDPTSLQTLTTVAVGSNADGIPYWRIEATIPGATTSPDDHRSFHVQMAISRVNGRVLSLQIDPEDRRDADTPELRDQPSVAPDGWAGDNLVATEDAAIAIVETLVLQSEGQRHLDALRPYWTVEEGVTPDGLDYWRIVGEKTEIISSIDLMFMRPFHLRVMIAKQDARIIEFSWFHPSLRAPGVDAFQTPPPDPDDPGSCDR